jgi:hypothetical protein
MNNQFGGHEGIIATNPSVLQGLDACGTRWNPICEGPLSGYRYPGLSNSGITAVHPTSSFVRVIMGVGFGA